MARATEAIALAAALLTCGVASAAERVLDRVVAVVNDDVIALSELYEVGSDYVAESCPAPVDAKCRADMELEILEALIRGELQRDELVRLGSDVSEDEISRQIDEMVLQYGFADRAAFRAEIEAQGASWESYRKHQIEAQLRTARFQQVVLQGRVTVSEDEIRDAYQRAARSPDAPMVARIQAFGYRVPDPSPDVLAAKVQELHDVLVQVRAGERTWTEVAAAWDTAQVGGAFEGHPFRREELQDALAIAAFDTEVGTYAEPVLVGDILFGVHVLSRERGTIELPPFDAVRDSLEQQLFMQKLELAAEEWYQAARRRAAIRVLLTPSTPAPAPAATP